MDTLLKAKSLIISILSKTMINKKIDTEFIKFNFKRQTEQRQYTSIDKNYKLKNLIPSYKYRVNDPNQPNSIIYLKIGHFIDTSEYNVFVERPPLGIMLQVRNKNPLVKC